MEQSMRVAGRSGFGMAVVLSSALGVGTVAACGDAFTSACKESRTCPPMDSGSSGGAAGGDSPEGDPLAGNGASGTPDAGAPSGGAPSENLPLSVVDTSPAADSDDVEPDAEVVVTFSRPLDPHSVTSDSVQLLDGDVPLSASLDYADGAVTLKPKEPLSLLVKYTLRVTTDIVDEHGDALPEIYTQSFVTRDGEWHVTEVATDTDDSLGATSLPMTANGDTLVTWTLRVTGRVCSTFARWFNRGESVGAPAAFTTPDMDECFQPSVAANAAGVAGLFSGALATDQQLNITALEAKLREYRAGEWMTVRKVGGNAVSVGVTPEGSVAFFAPGAVGVQALQDGTLEEIGGEHVSKALPQVAFNGEGLGFAGWSAQVPGTKQGEDGADEVLVARYTLAGGWEAAKPLPGSVAAVGGPNDERGAPALAFDDAGGAMALWVREGGGVGLGALVASRYTKAGDWGAPVPLSGNTAVTDSREPSLVFDGHGFVAAWVGKATGASFPYTARYDLASSKWTPYESRSKVASADVMPRLGADAHHNLLLTWVAPSPQGASLVYARFSALAGEWGEPIAVPNGALGGGVSTVTPSPLSVNGSGLGALMWSVAPDFNKPATLQYASFH